MQSLDLVITDLARELFLTALMLAGPMLIGGLIVGLAVSLFQALTSIQEQTLSLVPKMLIVGVIAILMLAPGLGLLTEYAHRVLERMNTFGLT
jgi:flagellar biosynthetic protein FliQ